MSSGCIEHFIESEGDTFALMAIAIGSTDITRISKPLILDTVVDDLL
jgi:hypothetical protein